METIRNNKAAETILEFNKIREIWKGYAMTDGAKEAIEGAAPILSESQVLARLRETTEARDMIQRSGQPPLVSLSGIREWMRLAEIGGCLTAEQLEGMERALAAVDLSEIPAKVGGLLETIQHDMFERAKAHRDAHTYDAHNLEEMKDIADNKPGFIRAMWCGCQECEDKLKEEAGVTSRCMPFKQEKLADTCVYCGKPATKMVYWGKAY